MDRDEIDGLLRTAVVRGNVSAMDALVSAGPAAVESFHDWLEVVRPSDLPPGTDSRVVLDNMRTVSGRLATQFPSEFVAAFQAPRWRSSSEVLYGFGKVQDPWVQPILIEVLLGDAHWSVRTTTASALASFPGDESVQALLAVLDDPEYLVQYHAIRALGTIGNRAALDRLQAIALDPPNRGVAMVVGPDQVDCSPARGPGRGTRWSRLARP